MKHTEAGVNKSTMAGAAPDNGSSLTQPVHKPLPSAHSFRYHLPTQSEIDHSSALIVEWEKQIHDTLGSIKELDNDRCSQVRAIEKDFKERMQKAIDEAEATADKKSKPLKRKLKTLEERVNREKGFLAPIRKLPVEVVTEIIACHLDTLPSDSDIRRRWQIASVCKNWRTIILGTARFWKNIDSGDWSSAAWSLQRLKRRLELSASIALNVSLHYPSWKNDEDLLLEHFRALAQAGIHRWRSLTIKPPLRSNATPSPLLGIFGGKLNSLLSLDILCGGHGAQQDAFEPLYALIAATGPSLEKFKCYRSSLPSGFTEANMFYNLKSLHAVPSIVAAIVSKANASTMKATVVRKVFVDYMHMPYEVEFKAFNLPHITTFSRVTFAELSECGLSSVQNLNIENFDQQNRSNEIDPAMTPHLHFQDLHTLNLNIHDKNPLLWMLRMTAPNLSHLTIDGRTWETRETTPIIQEFFVEKWDQIRIQPTYFDAKMALSAPSVIQIMDKWSQLVHLSFKCPSRFGWNGFAKSMCKRKNPPCPNLRVLQIYQAYTLHPDAVQAWREVATTILRHRKGIYPLEEIASINPYGKEKSHIVVVSDV